RRVVGLAERTLQVGVQRQREARIGWAVAPRWAGRMRLRDLSPRARCRRTGRAVQEPSQQAGYKDASDHPGQPWEAPRALANGLGSAWQGGLLRGHDALRSFRQGQRRRCDATRLVDLFGHLEGGIQFADAVL